MKLSILSEMFSTCWWWLFFWMLLSFLLGWILRKIFGDNTDNDNCCNELEDLKFKYHKLLSEKTAPVNTVTSSALGVQAKPSGGAFSKLKEDNLQIIEGIGPKMNEVLNKYGIKTWSDLASKTYEELRALLDDENPKRYRIINPKTWPEQAALARDGKWEELIQLQKELDTGNEDAMGETDSKLEKIMIKMGLLKKWKKDDLKAIEGIGPKIEKLFKENGIDTWDKLANTSVATLQSVLAGSGDRFKLADPGTWPQQAALAAAGKWDELQELQDKLIGGR